MPDPILKTFIKSVQTGTYKTPARIWVAVSSAILYGTIATRDDLISVASEQLEESIGDTQHVFSSKQSNQGPSTSEERDQSFCFTMVDITIFQGGVTFAAPFASISLEHISAWGLDLPLLLSGVDE